ncbi:ribonuclease III [Paraburkholderia sp. MMS20-SJTN17]|uniref:Ribonuclease 3 n=1 Tax=Paraburkholderia translucens TaxID=2886945 RepID=A0ABS8KG58_9BURK|nr:ribonuclease III [Paraburkholderia sp. MMS20-SJTN17]MCC8403741.1 ribonuclease III [Paraburkholderia sp. MMS20-SJTN17]
MPLSPLESRLRYEFRNAELLRQALTHRSHSSTHNERLEFLGDSVLNCAVAALLFQRFGKLDEGDLSRVRANLVKQQSLYEIAQALNISEGLRLGEGELRSGGFRRPSILADTLEAVLGAVFLDGGFDAAQTVIKRLYVPILDHIDPRTLGKDAKTLLQEYLQGHKIALPTYTVVATHGAAHNQQFEVECTVPKLDVKVSGSGASRRAAEQAAAKKALDEVMAAAPAVVGKPKRSKGARAAKNGERDIVPGMTGVQAALDLRTPDRKSERATARGEGRMAVTVEANADKSGVEKSAAEKAAAERAAAAAVGAPLAVIRAAHVEYSGLDKPERAEKSDKAERADKVTVHTAEKPVDKPTEKPAADKAPDLKADAPSHARGADRQRSREIAPGTAASSATSAPVPAAAAVPASAEHEPGVADAVQTRVADAGH